MLHEFLVDHRAELIARCESKVTARRSPRALEPGHDHGVPLFIDQLTDTLRRELRTNPAMDASATRQGNELQRRGYTVDQVVHGYGDVCQSVTELAVELDAPITNDEFRVLNRCLDNAIADAVTEHARMHDRGVSDEHTEQLGVLAHEMRNLLNAAGLAFGAISAGQVGVTGSTAAVVLRSLSGLRRLVDRSLTEVRLEAGVQNRQSVSVAELVEEIRLSTLVTEDPVVHLDVPAVDEVLTVLVDRQTLASVLTNLLQNAFKFSKAGGTVTLGVRHDADRVLIEIADACGGLPEGAVEDLFRPYEQRGADRSGVGLGLSICRRGVESNGGSLGVRDVPGSGCVFWVDLPR